MKSEYDEILPAIESNKLDLYFGLKAKESWNETYRELDRRRKILWSGDGKAPEDELIKTISSSRASSPFTSSVTQLYDSGMLNRSRSRGTSRRSPSPGKHPTPSPSYIDFGFESSYTTTTTTTTTIEKAGSLESMNKDCQVESFFNPTTSDFQSVESTPVNPDEGFLDPNVSLNQSEVIFPDNSEHEDSNLSASKREEEIINEDGTGTDNKVPSLEFSSLNRSEFSDSKQLVLSTGIEFDDDYNDDDEEDNDADLFKTTYDQLSPRATFLAG